MLCILFLMTGCTAINTASDDNSPPLTPKNFILLGGGDGQAHLKWERNNEQDFKEYRLYRSIDNQEDFSLLIVLNQTEYLDRFLEYETTYYYYITAVDFAGNESLQSNIINVQPLNVSAPQPPSNINVTAINNPLTGIQEINITWLPPNISDLKEFQLYRSINPYFVIDEDSFIKTTVVASFTDKDVVLNQKYYYKITAVDKALKQSLPSEIVSDIILSSPVLIIPANFTLFSPPYSFRWEKVDEAVNYKVFVGNAPLSSVFWSSNNTTETELNYTGPVFEKDKIYYWWVATYSKTGNQSINSYSIVNSFFVE